MRNFISRLRRFALIRLCVEAAVLFIAIAVMSRVFSPFVPPAPSPLHAGLAVLRSLLLIALLLAVYTGLVRWLEQRRAIEIGLRASAAQLPIGALIGMSLMSAVLLILWALNAATFGSGSGLEGVGIGVAAALLAAVFEELLFRAVLYRILEQCCGTTIALIVSACVFGLLHGMNAGATLFSDAAIAVEAGLLLAMAYALTRNLWLAIGIHAGWNFRGQLVRHAGLRHRGISGRDSCDADGTGRAHRRQLRPGSFHRRYRRLRLGRGGVWFYGLAAG
jgi:uncharacterized protein